MLFEAVSGLHVNWDKGLLFPVTEVPDSDSQTLEILGCEVGTPYQISLSGPGV